MENVFAQSVLTLDQADADPQSARPVSAGMEMFDNDDTFNFAERMTRAAQMAGNATKLAEATGISRRAIGDYLAGKAEPSRPRLVAIAKTAGVSLEWLATGDGNMHPNADVRIAPLNIELLEDAIVAVEDYVQDLKEGIDHSIKAGLILLLYTLGDDHNPDLIAATQDSINQLLIDIAA